MTNIIAENNKNTILIRAQSTGGLTVGRTDTKRRKQAGEVFVYTETIEYLLFTIEYTVTGGDDKAVGL